MARYEGLITNRTAEFDGRDGGLKKIPAVPQSQYRSKLEERYAAHLAAEQAAGRVVWWRHEAITLKLADKLRYTPDFVVEMASGVVACHEVKGYWRDDARAKIKMAATTYPWMRFIAVTWEQRAWKVEEFSAWM